MESTLSLTVTDLYAEAGDFLGWGGGPANGDEEWTPDKARRIRSCVETALRGTYFQAQLQADGPVHKWSFLQPIATVVLESGMGHAALPEDFGGFEGQVTVSQASGGGFCSLPLYSEARVRQWYAESPAAKGRPQSAALEAQRGTTKERGSRMKLLVYPLADSDYTLQFTYYILPDYLTSAHPYPYGGAAHAETFKAAVRAAAELMQDGVRGAEFANARERLSASISYDRRMKPQVLGYNGDRSDTRDIGYSRDRIWYETNTTFNGVDPNF